MKKLIALLLSAFLLTTSFVGCSEDKKERKTASVDSINCQENWNRYQDGGSFAESDDSVYFIWNSFVFVVDKKTRKCAPLCNRPDCEHEKNDLNKSCNAFVYNEGHSCVSVCDDALYFTSTENKTDENGNDITYFKIEKSNLDLSDRKDVFSTSELLINWFKIHRGYIYMNASTFDDDGSSSDETAAIYRMPLSGGKPKKLKIPYFGDSKYTLSDARLFGNKLYISFDHLIDDENSQTAVCTYDIESGKLNEISKNLNPKPNGTITVLNKKLYYERNNKIYVADLNGEKSKEFFDCKTVTNNYSVLSLANNDGKRLSIVCKKDNWWEKENYGNCALIYLDEKGKAEFCDLPVKTEPYIGGNADFTLSFETKYGDGNDDGTRKLYFIDKKKLGSKDCVSEIYTLKD